MISSDLASFATPTYGGSALTFYRWLVEDWNALHPQDSIDLVELKQLEEENAKLKRLVADLSLDKTMLQDVLRRKW